MSRLTKLGKNLAIIVGIVTGLSTIAGLMWNIYEDARATREQREAQQIAQLSSYANFGEVLKQYHVIGQTTADFMKENWNQQWNCDSLLGLYTTGAGIYYSDDMKQWADVRIFYEDLGILIRYGALDFELVYQAIIFPADLVELNKPLTDCVGQNWFGRGKPVEEFSRNLHMLHRNYERKRKGKEPVWDDFE